MLFEPINRFKRLSLCMLMNLTEVPRLATNVRNSAFRPIMTHVEEEAISMPNSEGAETLSEEQLYGIQ